ncbi:PREDICTED: zinc finger protein 831 [Myotis davidii]|uniref:zinc finger protein 831 n=1 Tax=Myotis davidii TaxID=225400 RepID=UPI000766F30A|nr:PREDICTED: zinc finger protein 831 [Myotis davidii]
MEVPELNCPASPARDQPALAPGTPAAPGQQASPHLTLGPIILPPEQSLAPTVFLKALPIPLYHTVPPGGLQPRAPLVTGSVDGGSVPFILSPLLQPEGPGPAQVGKPVTPTVTVNIVGTLPVLSPGPTLGSPGKARKAGKYLCPHCGRDCLKPSVLEKHVRSHTGERPFPCATCGIAFKTQSNLYKHRRTQTHLNNSRLSVGSDGAGGSLLEEGDKAAETPGAAGRGDSGSVGGGDGARSERPLSPGVQGSGHCLVPPMHLPPIAKSLDLQAEALFCPVSTLADREAPLDATHAAPVGTPLGSAQCGRKPPGQKSPTASRGSPPHSLLDHSVESEREGAPRPGGARAEPGGQEPSLELEKRQLEERIARLISHNQAVVDDPQLDHVRPRKTVLSKQGSIDLPVPYTYKDSFHFEIRALGPGRRRHGALCPTRSTCMASDRVQPLLFHSVPTQLSTTVECVPVTRSHSLPFVEGTRTWQEPLDPQDTRPGRRGPLSPRSVPARLGEVPGSHPRALPDLPVLEEAVGGEGAAPSQDGRTPACGDTSVVARPGPGESPPAAGGFLVTKPPKQREPVARARGSEGPGVGRAPSPPALSIQEPWCLHSTSFVLHPNGRPELGSQLPPVSRPLKGGDLEAPRLVFPDPKLEGGPRSGGDTQGPWQQALAVPTPPSRSSGEPQPAGDKLPSEKKKLRVEQLGSLGVRDQAPGGPAQDSSPPSLNQDSDSGDRLHTSADGRGASGTSFSAPLVALRPAGPGPKAPVCGPAAGAPGGTASLPAQPSDTTFPPKYLLRLPQGETPQLLAGDPERSQGPLCRSELPQDPTSSAGPGLGTLPATRLAPGGANNFGEDSSWPRLWDRRKEVPGEEKGDLDTSTPAAGESPGWSVGVPRETASALPTPPCDPGRSETRDAGQLCVGSMWARAWPSGGVLSPWTLSREVAGSPGPLAGHRPCRPLEPSSILPAPLPSGCPERAWSRISESSGLCGPQGPFPLLRAEPRLTWCCLSGSLPLPREQKERATSAYWALHCPGSSAPAQGADVRPVSKAESGRRTGTSPAGGGETQPWKLSCPTAPGMTSGDPGSEPGWTKGPPRRRAKMCRGSSKQKALRRYRGSFLQGRVRLRASRLRKPLWVLRRDCHLPQLEGLDPRRTLGQASSEMAGLSLQGESSCAATASPLGCGDREKEEKAWRPTPGGSFPSTRPRAVRDRDTWTVQDTVPSAGACGDRCPQNAAVGSGLALPSDSRMHMGDHSLPSCGKGLDPGMPETQRLPSQEPVSADPKPRAFSEAQEPLAFESKGSSPRHDTATSVAAIGTSLGTGGGHTTPGAPSAEPQGQGRAAGETQTQSSPASKALAQGLSPSLWPGKPSPGRRLSGSVPSRSPGKAHPDTPTSGPGPAGSQQEEGRPEVCCLPGGQEEGAPPPGCALECGEVLAPRPPAGKDTEETPESGLMALKDGVVPSTPGQPAGAQEASSKTIKKRSLGGMRKQTRVEFSDTSSDDEDRLVIEI